jgi:hypothetical protein
MARNVSPEVAAAYPLALAKPLPGERRANLIVFRAGARSVHRDLFPLPPQRTWDLALSCYEPPTESDLAQADIVTTGAVAKWDAFAQMRFGRPEFRFDQYDYVCLADDDVVFKDAGDIDRLFGIAREHRLSICQPSLTPQSYGFWGVTQHHPSWFLRYTNFVECMAPVLSAEAIEVLREDLCAAVSGCGLDLVFHSALGPNRRLAVIDGIMVTHVEPMDPVNGKFYVFLRSIGIETMDETMWFLAKYGLEGIAAMTLGGIPHAQRFYPRDATA